MLALSARADAAHVKDFVHRARLVTAGCTQPKATATWLLFFPWRGALHDNSVETLSKLRTRTQQRGQGGTRQRCTPPHTCDNSGVLAVRNASPAGRSFGNYLVG